MTTVEFAETTTARSTFPSRLKSPAAIQLGVAPICIAVPAVNVPVLLPSKIDTVVDVAFDTARSGIPSPLKSPEAVKAAPDPTGIVCAMASVSFGVLLPTAADVSTVLLAELVNETLPVGAI